MTAPSETRRGNPLATTSTPDAPTSSLHCADCNAPAAYELLHPDGTPFTPRLIACEFGGRGFSGPKRRLTLSDVSGSAGHTARLAASEGGRAP